MMMSTTTGRAAALLSLVLPLALPLALPPPARAEDAGSVAEQTVETMHTLFGQHPGVRSNHAKGLVVEGSFTPSEAGARLSRSPLFRSGAVPVVARFSDATGVPDIADGAAQARPNGMAVRFSLPGDEQMDMVLNSLPFFPVATGEEFLELLRAAAASGPGSAKPTAVERFVQAHPSAGSPALAVSAPTGLDRAPYNGINAFVFVDAAGKRQPFRVRVVPVDGVQTLSPEDARGRPPNYLMDGIGPRLAQGPMRFRFMAQLAKPDDQTRDASRPWPDDREVADLGTIALTRLAPEGERIAKETVFMPSNLTDGIEVSDDPLIDARVQAYAVSFGQRSR
jgi:catalase